MLNFASEIILLTQTNVQFWTKMVYIYAHVTPAQMGDEIEVSFNRNSSIYWRFLNNANSQILESSVCDGMCPPLIVLD